MFLHSEDAKVVNQTVEGFRAAYPSTWRIACEREADHYRTLAALSSNYAALHSILLAKAEAFDKAAKEGEQQ